jgi:hypothetical protein
VGAGGGGVPLRVRLPWPLFLFLSVTAFGGMLEAWLVQSGCVGAARARAARTRTVPPQQRSERVAAPRIPRAACESQGGSCLG